MLTDSADCSNATVQLLYLIMLRLTLGSDHVIAIALLHYGECWNVPGERPMRERLDRVLLPFILKWIGMESRMACRYFSCSRLLDESEDEAGAEDTTLNLNTDYLN